MGRVGLWQLAECAQVSHLATDFAVLAWPLAGVWVVLVVMLWRDCK